VQFRRWRGQPSQHRRNVFNIGCNRDGVAPVLRYVIHDIGAPHGSDGTSPLFLEAQPIVNVGNIMSNDHPWHRHLPLAALPEIRRQEPLFSTPVCRPETAAASLRIGGWVNQELCLVSEAVSTGSFVPEILQHHSSCRRAGVNNLMGPDIVSGVTMLSLGSLSIIASKEKASSIRSLWNPVYLRFGVHVAKYRNGLPQLGQQVFLTDTGLETTLIFRDAYELPYFASFVVLESEAGREHMAQYYRTHATIAQSVGAGFIFESVGWRASKDWGKQIGYSPASLDQVNRDSIALMADVQREFDSPAMPTVLSGCIGPRGDAYNPATMMTEKEAEEYHRDQIRTYSETDADMISALTMSYNSEAIGVVRAAASLEMPVAISFTVETDGTLPSGMMLGDAIRSVDEATDAAAAYFMINCAFPTHFETILDDNADWTRRIRGVRANASRKSHAELDDSEELDAGDPDELAEGYARLQARFSTLTVLGGCCGTDERHLQKIGLTCVSP